MGWKSPGSHDTGSSERTLESGSLTEVDRLCLMVLGRLRYPNSKQLAADTYSLGLVPPVQTPGNNLLQCLASPRPPCIDVSETRV